MGFFDTHLNDVQFYGFAAAILLGVSSIYFLLKNKTGLSVLLLFACALMLRLVMAGMDPFLNLWDEQYHALVARNMMDHPFKPMLVMNPVLDFNIEDWSRNHIWLHKQPLFLWQMALSMEFFGVNEFALRLPSALLSALMVLLIFRIGKLLVNERAGWCGAFLFTFSNFQLEMALGRINTDHNDTVFMFYVMGSIWAWVEYMQNKNRKWVLLIGVFAGMAILVKWLTGLLVFSGWGIAILSDKQLRTRITSYKDMLLAFMVTAVIILPWQIYKSVTFPVESAIEYKFYALHFTMALDGHGGPWWYHLAQLQDQFGAIIAWLLIPALIIFFLSIPDRRMRTGTVTFLVLIYVFFSLAKTKMPLLCVAVSPLLFLVLGTLLQKIISMEIISKRVMQVISLALLLFLAVYSLNMNSIEQLHTSRDPSNVYRQSRIHNTEVAKQAASLLPSKDLIVFNCGDHNAVLVMFYTGNTAYDQVPDESTYHRLKEKGVKMAVFKGDKVPEYMQSDPQVLKIDLQPEGF